MLKLGEFVDLTQVYRHVKRSNVMVEKLQEGSHMVSIIGAAYLSV